MHELGLDSPANLDVNVTEFRSGASPQMAPTGRPRRAFWTRMK